MSGLPKAQGLYDPKHEHDACGVGAVVNISGRHQGEPKAKQELGRKLIEWCRP